MDISEGTIAGRLSFDAAEETYHLAPDETLTFGRAAKAVRLKTIPAGSAEPLTTAQGMIRFFSGSTGYEVRWELERPLPKPVVGDGPGEADMVTADFGNVRLSQDQRRMMTVMAGPRLRDPARPLGIVDRIDPAIREASTC